MPAMWRVRAFGLVLMAVLVLQPLLFAVTLETWTIGVSDAESDGVDQATASLVGLPVPVITFISFVLQPLGLITPVDAASSAGLAPSHLFSRAPPPLSS
jgi:hypothetical protein